MAAMAGQDAGPFDDVLTRLDKALDAGPVEDGMTREQVELRRALHLRR